MVTIEQKLALFSKLLNQDIKEEMEEKFTQLDQEYERRIAQSKFNTDKEAEEIIDEARRRAEIKRGELMSKSRLSNRKEMMNIKNELIGKFMDALERKVVAFTQTPEYLVYLKEMLSHLKELEDCQNPLEIYLSPSDYDHAQELIRTELIKLNIQDKNVSFKVANTPILGGLIIVDLKENTRINLSMKEIIEENKTQIIDKVTKAFGEVGETEND